MARSELHPRFGDKLLGNIMHKKILYFNSKKVDRACLVRDSTRTELFVYALMYVLRSATPKVHLVWLQTICTKKPKHRKTTYPAIGRSSPVSSQQSAGLVGSTVLPVKCVRAFVRLIPPAVYKTTLPTSIGRYIKKNKYSSSSGVGSRASPLLSARLACHS